MEYIIGDTLRKILKGDQQKIVLYVMSDNTQHSIHNSLSCMYIKTQDSEFYSVFDHPDYPKESADGLVINNAYTTNIKDLMNLNVSVQNSIDLLYFNSLPEPSPLQHFYQVRLGNVTNINRVIPVYDHINHMKEMATQLKPKSGLTDKYKTMYHHVIPTVFSSVERLGVPINDDLFLTHYGQDKRHLIRDNRVYTSYNLYTTTGRPSNTHGGINYAALNKTDGSRSVFQSDNILINIDFNSYHLFLICEKLGIELPKNAHEWLGKMYFNKDTLTETEYDEAKKITFKNLYGYHMDESVKKLHLFQEIEKLQENLWAQYQQAGYLVTDYENKIVVENASKNKVFNYYIQALETETNAKQLYNLISSDVVPILYTYDSMIFEVDKDSVSTNIKHIRNILKEKLMFPYSVKIGHNFEF